MGEAAAAMAIPLVVHATAPVYTRRGTYLTPWSCDDDADVYAGVNHYTALAALSALRSASNMLLDRAVTPLGG